MLRTNFFKTALASIMMIACVLGFYSCSSDEDGDDPNQPGDEAAIIGKWEVSNQNAEYGSFEFTGDKKYIITQQVKGMRAEGTRADNYIIIIFGDYSAVSSTDNEFTLNLKEFGTIVISISGSSATITVNGETYDTSKAKEVTVTDNTKLLCHTWKIDKAREYTPSDEEEPEWIFTGTGETLTFTNNGTYIQYDPNLTEQDKKDGMSEYDYGTWKWIDSKTLEITSTSYHSSIGLEGGEPGKTWTETETARYTVTELTNNKLTLDEITEFNPEWYEPGDEYTLWLSR